MATATTTTECARFSGSDPLTGREQEVLQLLVQGVTTTHELATRLVVTDNTVKFHVRNILDKLQVHNRAQVVAHVASHLMPR